MIIIAERSCGCVLIYDKMFATWNRVLKCDECEKSLGEGVYDPFTYPFFYHLSKGKTYKSLINKVKNFETKVLLASMEEHGRNK